ncbi:hypothetical protein C8Q80DRAFT_1275156 [Daedaleopsis nitida]|nr:hypothetical protein C8Q80DRAFT_1275156 [Daedaleopsis nitida]
MKFVLAPLLFAAAAAAAPAALEARQTTWCYISSKTLAYGYGEQFSYDLATACADDSTVYDSANLWNNKVCVAAAVASVQYFGSDVISGRASCHNPDGITSQEALPSLDYNLYASIVGDCAWAPGGCPMTKQNYIDLVHSAIGDANKGNWPSSVDVLVSQGWDKLVDWTKTGETVPYTNLDDFLHYYP